MEEMRDRGVSVYMAGRAPKAEEFLNIYNVFIYIYVCVCVFYLYYLFIIFWFIYLNMKLYIYYTQLYLV